MIIPARYESLSLLCWNRDPSRPIEREEAWSLYARNWRLVWQDTLDDVESELIESLRDEFSHRSRPLKEDVEEMNLREHLRDRHCPDPDLYRSSIDEDGGTVTFPLWNLSGQYCGYQRYRPAAGKVKNNDPYLSRYFTWRPAGSLGVFGLETWSWTGPLFVQEGVFDAIRLHSRGVSAIATLSNNPRFLDEWLYLTGRPVYSLLDGGAPGDLMARYCHRTVKLPEGHDAGSIPDELLDEILRELG